MSSGGEKLVGIDARHLFLVHAHGVLGLVHHGLAARVRILLAAHLVASRLSGRLLGVGDDIAAAGSVSCKRGDRGWR